MLRRGGIDVRLPADHAQVQPCVLALEGAGYAEVETLEVLVRTWHVTERSVRPDHRMVGHTGFLTVGRKGVARLPDRPGPKSGMGLKPLIQASEHGRMT